MEGDPGAARAEGVSQGDCAAVHVGAFAIEPQLLLHRQVLRRERFVHLDQIHVLERETRPLQRAPRRGHGSDPHRPGVHSRRRPRHQPADRGEAALGGIPLAREDQRRGTVADPGCVARGHHAVLPEIRRQLGQCLGSRVRAHVFVGGPGPRLARLLVLEHHRHDLVGVVAAGPRLTGPGLAERGVAVHRLPSHLILLGEVFRGLGHRESAMGIAHRLPEAVLERRRPPQPQSPARATHHVRRLTHALGAPGEDHPRLPKHDLLRRLRHRLEAGAAEPVDRDRGRLDRKTDAEPDVPGEIGGIGRGLEDVAEDHVVHLGRCGLRPGQRLGSGQHA